MLQRSPQAESGSKPRSVSPPQPQRHVAPKNDQTRVPAPLPIDKPISTPTNSAKKIEQTSFVVKQSLVTNNLLLVELQNRKSPAETYRVVVDLNLNSMTIRNASISNSSGVVKKFDLLESGSKISKGDEDSKENAGRAYVGWTEKRARFIAGEDKRWTEIFLGRRKQSLRKSGSSKTGNATH